jgi:hypothetical protein
MAKKFKDYYDGACAELIGRQPHLSLWFCGAKIGMFMCDV